jgi:hypothetical protein
MAQNAYLALTDCTPAGQRMPWCAAPVTLLQFREGLRDRKRLLTRVLDLNEVREVFSGHCAVAPARSVRLCGATRLRFYGKLN